MFLRGCQTPIYSVGLGSNHDANREMETKSSYFHMVHGEMTVTLKDVGIHLGFPIDGDVVTGMSSRSWQSLCEELLGQSPPNNALHFGRLKKQWIANKFDVLP